MRSAFRFPPSKDPASLELAGRLSRTEDLALFETKLIQIFIAKRWLASRWFFILESVLLLVGLVFLFLHASFFRNAYILVPLLLIQLWSFMTEIIDFSRRKCGYFTDFWNWFDLSRMIFSLVHFVLVLANAEAPIRTVTLTLLSLTHCVKVFSVFSLFKATRVLVRIVIEIVKDMGAFLLFVFTMTVTFSLLFTSAIEFEDLEHSSFPSNMLHVFLLDFGDFSVDEYSPLQEFLFVLGVIIVPLVLMNMLIAIMGDTFDRVKHDQTRRDF